VRTLLSLSLLALLGCQEASSPAVAPTSSPSSQASSRPTLETPVSTSVPSAMTQAVIVSQPTSVSLPSAPMSIPLPPEGKVELKYGVAAPGGVSGALGGKANPMPTGFENVLFSWTAADLVRERPWVVSESKLSPQLSFVYREAAYDTGTGRGDNAWLIANPIIGAVEYHFKRDTAGMPVGALHKIIFLLEANLPKDKSLDEIRYAGDAKWGKREKKLDQFQFPYDLWVSPKDFDVVFRYSSGETYAQAIELISKTTPAK
jgi:hypothetical protein